MAVAGVAALQHVLSTTSPLAALADEGAVVRVELELTSDVRVVAGQYGDLQVVRAAVTRLEGRGSAWTLDAPVVVMAGADWPRLPLGTRLETTARLVPGDGDVAALVRPTGEPQRRGRARRVVGRRGGRTTVRARRGRRTRRRRA